jgi:hypothetical protein
MVDKDFNKRIDEIARRAVQARKEELEEKRAREKEVQELARVEAQARPKQTGKQNVSFTATIIARLEYGVDHTPTKEQLAEDLGYTIKKWASQKGFTGIDPKEPVPALISVDVDVQ